MTDISKRQHWLKEGKMTDENHHTLVISHFVRVFHCGGKRNNIRYWQFPSRKVTFLVNGFWVLISRPMPYWNKIDKELVTVIISIKLKKEFESNILLCECVVKKVICKSPLNTNLKLSCKFNNTINSNKCMLLPSNYHPYILNKLRKLFSCIHF